MQEKINAYFVTYTIDAKNDKDVKGLVIVAHTPKEAGDILVRWLDAINQRAYGVAMKQLEKTKNNAHWFTRRYFDLQLQNIESLEAHRKADA